MSPVGENFEWKVLKGHGRDFPSKLSLHLEKSSSLLKIRLSIPLRFQVCKGLVYGCVGACDPYKPYSRQHFATLDVENHLNRLMLPW